MSAIPPTEGPRRSPRHLKRPAPPLDDAPIGDPPPVAPEDSGGTTIGKYQKGKRPRNVNRDKTCKDCRKQGHASKRSPLCEQRKGSYHDLLSTTGRTDDGDVKRTSFKNSMASCWTPAARAVGLPLAVERQVQLLTRAAHEASIVVLLDVTRRLEAEPTGASLPTFKRPYLRCVVKGVMDMEFARGTDAGLRETLTQYRAARGARALHLQERAFPINSNVLGYFLDQQVTTIAMHVERQFAALAVDRIERLIKSHGVEHPSQAGARARRVWFAAQGAATQPDAPPLDEQLLAELRVNLAASVSGKLACMHRWNAEARAAGDRACTLTPLSSTRARYIDVDTKILHALLVECGADVSSEEVFMDVEGRQQRWREWVLLPERYAHQPVRGSPRRHFDCHLQTDGVGTSFLLVRLSRNVIPPNEPPGGENARQGGEVERQEVGIDPGRRSVITAVWADDEGGNVRGREYRLSAGRWHHLLRSVESAQKKSNLQRQAGVLGWVRATPTLRAATAAEVVAYVRTRLDHPLHDALLCLELTYEARKLRWGAYINKQLAFDTVLRELLPDRVVGIF